MRRAAKYIMLFFAICYLLGDISKSITEKMYFSNAPKVITEITERLVEKGETLNLDGKIVEAYVIASGGNSIIFDGNEISWHQLGEQVTSNRKNYNIHIDKGIIDIKSLEKHEYSTLTTLNSVNKIITYKNIGMNALVISAGILLYLIYNQRSEKRKSEDDEDIEISEQLVRS